MITKIKKEVLNKAEKIGEFLKNGGISKDSIKNVNFTLAKNCLIEFEDDKNVEKALALNPSDITDSGGIIRLTFIDQNNFILIKETKAADFKNQVTDDERAGFGILHYEDIKSRIFNKESTMIKAYRRDSTCVNKLVKDGMKFDYKTHRVTKFEKRPSVVVCFRCSGFGHKAAECKKTEKC